MAETLYGPGVNRTLREPTEGLGVTLPVSQAPASQPEGSPENPLVALLDHGNRRQWHDLQLLPMIQALQDGLALPDAARGAGIPVSTAYWLRDSNPVVAEAIGIGYARGADAYDSALHGIVFGAGDPRKVPAIVASLKLRGKLQSQAQSTQVQGISITIQTVPGARDPDSGASHAPAPTRVTIEAHPAHEVPGTG